MDFLNMKGRTMTELQEYVAALGICTQCHKKTLKFRHGWDQMSVFQCTDCFVVFVLPKK